MKKFLFSLLAVLLLGYLGTLVAWWGLALVAVLVGFAFQANDLTSFVSGFTGGALFFGLYAYYLDNANEGRLSSMMAEVLQFEPFIPTIILGGLLAGLGMLVGQYARDLLAGKKKTPKYRGKYN